MAESTALEDECVTFTRYLVDAPPSPHVRQAYLRAHAQGIVPPPAGTTAYDLALLRAARRGGLSCRAADVHARFFRPGGLLRRKLVLLLAILETDGEGRGRVDEATPGGPVGLVLRFAALGLVSAGLLVLGLPFFMLARSDAPAELGAGPDGETS